MSLYNLESIFKPESVAVIGASEKKGTIGRALMENLVQTEFGGDVYPVNPKYDNLLGYKAYGKIAKTPAVVDMAVIAVPLVKVPTIIEECVDAGVKGAIIISAGGKETGSEGRKLEEDISHKSEAGGVQLDIRCWCALPRLTMTAKWHWWHWTKVSIKKRCWALPGSSENPMAMKVNLRSSSGIPGREEGWEPSF